MEASSLILGVTEGGSCRYRPKQFLPSEANGAAEFLRST